MKYILVALLVLCPTLAFAWEDNYNNDPATRPAYQDNQRQIQQIERQNQGAIDPNNGTFYAPAAGRGLVNTRDGSLYVPAGPNGYIDTRTGQFVPAH